MSAANHERSRTIEVYDPAMCCPTGVCGPSVDPVLARFAADLEWLRGKGVTVARYNLAQDPGAFAAAPAVQAMLAERGTDCLPLVLAGGEVVASGNYPDRKTLAAAAGIPFEATPGMILPLAGTGGGEKAR